MFIVHSLLLILGLGALIRGADLLVDKADLLAKRLRVNPFFVGVILLGMGTSAPEWAVSAISSLKGLPNLAVGNVFGSNIFNILLVLGIVLLTPLASSNIRLIKKDIMFLVLSGFVLIPLMLDHFLSRYDAFFLSVIFVVYIALSLFSAQKEQKETAVAREEVEPAPKEQPGEHPSAGEGTAQAQAYMKAETAETVITANPVGRAIGLATIKSFLLSLLETFKEIWGKIPGFFKEWFFISIGFCLLIGGSHLTVIGASGIGAKIGMSERLIGILIVSVGTSLPELFTSLTAILKGEKNMAVGNIIGSNIFNTFAILSTSAWILPVAVDRKMFMLDLPVLLLTHISLLLIVFCYQIQWIKKNLSYLFFAGYLAYLVLLLVY